MAATMTTNEPYTTIGLTVPARMFREYLPDPEKAVGVRFSGKTGLSKIVSYLLLTMWEYAQGDEFEKIGAGLAHNLLGILATCCEVHGDRPAAYATNTVAKREEIKRIIQQNLHRSDLCVTEIAKRCGLSVRYVQRLFSDEDHTASEYIRTQRLKACMKQLADPAWLHHSITEIAFNWGFNSSAHFARVFKAECGINAREFRSQALHARTLDASLGAHDQEALSPAIKCS
jgi:AraC-like DNA-binding protein